LQVPRPRAVHPDWGPADFFDNRRKSMLLKIADLSPDDLFYELGCGDANLLIYVTRKAGLKHATGFEIIPSRAFRARKKVKDAGLEDRITIRTESIYTVDLSKSDVIFAMLCEREGDYRYLFSKRRGIRDGTRLIRHDLPLIGFLPDRIELPFYRMTYPLVKAKTRAQWVRSVLQDPDTKVEDLWQELAYYSYEKGYTPDEIRYFQSMLVARVR